MSIARTLLGVGTVVRRRGFGYLGYLMAGVVVPQLAYRWGWGAAAPRAARAFFHALARARTQAAPADRAGEFRAAVTAAAAVPTVERAAIVEAVLDRAHAEGFTGLASYARGETAREPAPVRRHRSRGILFAAERNRDRVAFNRAFGASLLTEESARRMLREQKAALPSGYRDYAPIDFGGGLTIGQIASTDSGTGRWAFFNRQVVAPLVGGRRILDLGSNNGSLPLMMLRAGARSLVGIEGDPAIAAFARLNARILAWRDMRDYDIEIITGDMRACLTHDLGRFDVVTAFCSLYYLPEADMARIITMAAEMNATLVLQANEAIDNLPAKAKALRRLMADNGYANVRVHEYQGFARPILVGVMPAAASTEPTPANAQLVGV